MPGTGGVFAPGTNLPRDEKQAAILKSRGALYGRTTYYAGPVPSYVQTYPGSGLTPAQIHNYQNEVLVAGWMVNWSSLSEQVLLRDGHLFSVDRSVRGAIASKPFFVRPRTTDGDSRRMQISAAAARYVQARIDGIDRFENSQYELLGAHGDGYRIQEIVWKQGVKTTLGDATIIADAPCQLDTVGNKHFRFDVAKGAPLLDMGKGQVVDVLQTPHKFLYHVTPGDGPSRRRGYMYQAVWLHLIKHNAIARWAVVLEIWGIPVPWVTMEAGLFQDETRKSEALAIARDYGLGLPVVTTDDMVLKDTPVAPSGDARGMHAALIGWANSEISKIVQLQTLTTELGGVGSYKASETHENTKETGDRMLARSLEDTDRTQLFRAILERAIYQYDDAGNAIGILSTGLCPALNASPEEILAELPRAFYRIDREMGPASRADVFGKAVSMGLKIEAQQFADEFALNLVDDSGRAIPGEPVTVADGAKVLGTIDAAEGIDNPKDPTTTAAGATGEMSGDSRAVAVDLTPSAQGAIIKVNEARATLNLPPLDGPDGELTINEFIAKHDSVTAEAAAATDGTASTDKPAPPAPAKSSLSKSKRRR